MTIYLHSATLHINVKPRLQELIKQAECLRMAVAYWTIPENYFGNSLIELLKKKESFACVDISSPTDIDEICKLAGKTDNLYFYTKSLAKDATKGKSESKNLLHSKILLFDLPNNLASIWIGSHNWTDRALIGKNIETSLEICIDKNSDIYTNIKDLLERIKADCHKVFNLPEYERIYKTTQKQEKSLLYLRSSVVEDPEFPLTSKPFIHLILDESKPNSKAFPFSKEIAFLMSSLHLNKEFLLVGKVLHSGGLPPLSKKSNWPNFENGYYCLRQNRKFTNFALKPEHQEFINKISNFSHYVTLEIEDVEEIYDIESQVFSKYQTPITLLNELTQLKFIDGVCLPSDFFEFKVNNKQVNISTANQHLVNLISNTNDIENIYDYEDSVLDLGLLHSRSSIRTTDSYLDTILNLIYLSKGEIIIKDQLVNKTEIENKISKIPRAIISKVVKKKN